MRTLNKRALRFVILMYGVIHFITVFYPNELLNRILEIAGIFLFFLTLFYLGFRRFKLPLFIFIIAISVSIYSKAPFWEGLLIGVTQMRNMIGFLIIVPLIRYVLQEEPYIEDMMASFYRWIDTSKRFYFSIVTFTQITAYFLLFGSITMMHQFVNIVLKKQKSLPWERYKSTALLRGFALSTIWVISIPSFIFAVDTLGSSLSITIGQGMALAFVGTIMAVLFAHFEEKRANVSFTPVLQTEIKNVVASASPPPIRRKNMVEFGVLFVSLFGTVFIVNGISPLSLMIIIPLVIVGWFISFYTVKKRIKTLQTVIQEYYRNNLSQQAYLLNIMVAVGVLIFALHETNFSNVVVDGITYIQSVIPFLNELAILPFLVILLGFVGLGPLTVMVLVAGILESMSLPYPPELIVLAVTSGSVISILISPLIMPVIVLSAVNRLPLVTNGLRFNWKFAIAFYLLIQLYLQVASHLPFFSP